MARANEKGSPFSFYTLPAALPLSCLFGGVLSSPLVSENCLIFVIDVVLGEGEASLPLSKERKRAAALPLSTFESRFLFSLSIFSLLRKGPSPPASLDGVEVLGRLPREHVGRLAAEVAVRRRLQVARLAQVERARDQSRAEVERLEHLREDLLVGDLARAVGVDVDRERLRDADGVRDLHDRAAGQARGDDGLGRLARDVGAGAVDLGRVLAREGAAAVGSPA